MLAYVVEIASSTVLHGELYYFGVERGGMPLRG